jgi:hypothetical protein
VAARMAHGQPAFASASALEAESARPMLNAEARTAAEYCRAKLDLVNAALPEEYYYSCLPLCVIDAVFSMGVRYSSTRNTVTRFCRYFGIEKTVAHHPPPTDKQLSTKGFAALYDEFDPVAMAEAVYQNLQRTSTRNGILKSEAALLFAKTLQRFDIDYLQDVTRVLVDADFEASVRLIPGQTSGISLRYFFMLAGSDDLIKPDRMVRRFVEAATGRDYGPEECHYIVVQACQMLGEVYPQLTPRTLDYQIWRYQRDAGYR